MKKGVLTVSRAIIQTGYSPTNQKIEKTEDVMILENSKFLRDSWHFGDLRWRVFQKTAGASDVPADDPAKVTPCS